MRASRPDQFLKICPNTRPTHFVKRTRTLISTYSCLLPVPLEGELLGPEEAEVPRQRGHDRDSVDAVEAVVAVTMTVEGGGGRAALEGDLEVGEGGVHVVLPVVLARLRHVRLQPHLQLKE